MTALEIKQVCTRCVMDTTDSDISFDENGVCNHCLRFENEFKPIWFPNEKGNKILEKKIKEIKKKQKTKKYDCIMGLSGGVDSSYLAYLSRTWGLRILAIHVDAGWNSELAVQNIEILINKCNLDLFTYVVDWEEMKDMHLAFLKSGLANQDVPQDHIFFSILYQKAIELDIPYVLTGSNIATESILPQSWGYDAMDAIQIKAIHKKFGKLKKLKSYKTISFFNLYLYYRFFKKLKTIKPLDYIAFHKDEAKKELIRELGWKDYGLKHGESRFTKFFQNHYLPHKFGYDKRKAHLSSLIVSGQMTRSQALEELKKPLYDEVELENDKAYFAKKLGMSKEELENILNGNKKHYTDYPNHQKIFSFFNFLKKVKSALNIRRVPH